jgi:tetratricopeptide (TPR) repeat protein
VSLGVGWLYSVARREGDRAERNLSLATEAVGQLLVAADRNQKSVGADVPEMEAFRRELLERAKPFYGQFIAQQPDNERFVTEMGLAHFRLGEISRMLDSTQDAEREYRASIRLFEDLVRGNPANANHRQALARAYNALGELLRPSTARRAEAEKAYLAALALQKALVTEFPANDTYQLELARTYYNQGILFGAIAEPDDDAFRAADAGFRQAVEVLEPLAQKPENTQAAQELSRVYNNLAVLLSQGAQDTAGLQAARPYYERAVRSHQDLASRDPRNREYKLELAKFANNYSELLRELSEFALAKLNNSLAMGLLDELVRPAPSLGIEQADARNLRARILHSEGSPAAAGEYREALRLFQSLADTEAARHPALNQRYADLLVNLAAFRHDRPNPESARLLSDAVLSYVDFGRQSTAAGTQQGRAVLEGLSQVLPLLNESDRKAFMQPYAQLQREVEAGPHGGR